MCDQMGGLCDVTKCTDTSLMPVHSFLVFRNVLERPTKNPLKPSVFYGGREQRAKTNKIWTSEPHLDAGWSELQYNQTMSV